MSLWIEQLNHRHHVVSRVRFTEESLRLGRSYACDFLLDEGAADAFHLSLELSSAGKVVAQALGENVFGVVGGEDAVSRVELDGQTVIRIGKTLLRVRTDRDLLEGSGSVATLHSRISGWHSARQGVLAAVPLMLAVALMDIDKWLTTIDGDFLSGMITGSLVIVFLVVGWVGLCGIISYAINREGRMLHQLRVAGYCTLAVIASGSVLPLLQSALGAGSGGWLESFLAPGAIIAALFANVMVMVDKLRSRGFALIGVVATVAIGCLASYAAISIEGRLARPDVAKLAPTFVQLVPSHSRSDVIRCLGSMQAQVAATRNSEIPDDMR
jgi:hypothetical protein